VKKLRNKNKAGFTLIELLVVIAIIGLLASVVLLALNGARAKSRDAKRIADVRQLASAMEIFFNDYNGYPTNSATTYLVPNYIGVTPTAPSPQDGTCSSTQNNYVFSSPVAAPAATYSLTFCLGAATGGYPAGMHTLTQAGIQ
jgi:prepilin-type N-terminal cleavage/methylation domain-containing protein